MLGSSTAWPPMKRTPPCSISTTTKATNSTAKTSPFARTWRRMRSERAVSAMLLMKYMAPRVLARKNTAKPRSRFFQQAMASRPWVGAHREITGDAGSSRLERCTVKSAPKKNVPTATPRRVQPTMPLNISRPS